MHRREVEQAIYDAVEEIITTKYCPECKGDTTMVKVNYYPDTAPEEVNTGPLSNSHRCMRCLNIFIEKLEKQYTVDTLPNLVI